MDGNRYYEDNWIPTGIINSIRISISNLDQFIPTYTLCVYFCMLFWGYICQMFGHVYIDEVNYSGFVFSPLVAIITIHALNVNYNDIQGNTSESTVSIAVNWQ